MPTQQLVPGRPAARLAMRRTKTAEATYLAFICPHCNATSGDVFTRDALLSSRRDYTTLTLPPTNPPAAVAAPHWCLAPQRDDAQLGEPGRTCYPVNTETSAGPSGRGAGPGGSGVAVQEVTPRPHEAPSPHQTPDRTSLPAAPQGAATVRRGDARRPKGIALTVLRF